MKGADVLRALADGKKVHRANGDPAIQIDAMDKYSTNYFYKHEFDIVEEPATDAELVTEMLRLERECVTDDACEVATRCARMLERRSIKP